MLYINYEISFIIEKVGLHIGRSIYIELGTESAATQVQSFASFHSLYFDISNQIIEKYLLSVSDLAVQPL